MTAATITDDRTLMDGWMLLRRNSNGPKWFMKVSFFSPVKEALVHLGVGEWAKTAELRMPGATTETLRGEEARALLAAMGHARLYYLHEEGRLEFTMPEHPRREAIERAVLQRAREVGAQLMGMKLSFRCGQCGMAADNGRFDELHPSEGICHV